MGPLIEGEAIRRAVDAARGAGALVRVEFPLAEQPALGAVHWLAARPEESLFYWSDRRRTYEVAGAGIAARVHSSVPGPLPELFARMRAHLAPEHGRLRFYGGIAFDRTAAPGPEWNAFGAHQFVVPRYEVIRDGAAWYFACNWRRDDADTAIILEELAHTGEPPDTHGTGRPPALSREDLPGRDAWRDNVNAALRDIGEGRLEKIVLARRARFELAAALPPLQVLARMRRLSAGAYLFFFQPRNAVAFLSASPEQLCACRHGAVESEALAGTRPRGVSHDADVALADDLLHNDKELREHAAVAEAIRDVFARHCAQSDMEADASLVRLQECQHILRRVRGTMRAPGRDAELLQELHPTPAVGGVPGAAALERLRTLEPFSRGWYAGPVGWVGADGCEFAVGIRSGLIEGARAAIYAGAGIVAGSDPAAEWDEVETKMQAMIRLLAGES